MKNKNFYLFIVIILYIGLMGCKADTNFENSYNPETDYQYLYHRQGLLISMADSGDGYYFLNGQHIYYADKDDMKPFY